MWLHLLDPDQQHTYVKAAQLVILADGIVHEAEEELLATVQIEMAMDTVPAAPDDVDTFLEELEVFDTPVSKNVLMLELMAVAMADDEYHPREKELLERIASRLRIKTDGLEEFRQFAIRGLKLIEDARSLLSTNWEE